MTQGSIVAPAKAGVQASSTDPAILDSRFRGNDGWISQKCDRAGTISGQAARAFAVLLGFAMAACAQQPQPQPSAAADPAPADPLPRFIGVIGTRAQHDPPFLGVPGTNFYCLRSFVDRQTGETRHQLYVSDSYAGTERHWDAARDGAGQPLRFLAISHHEITCEGGCAYLDEFAADIPESELRANPQGLSVTFTAGSGSEMTIQVSGSQITAQLATVDAKRNPVQPAAAQPSAAHQ